MATKYSKVDALEIVSGLIRDWSAALSPGLAEDLGQEMAIAILESKQERATLSYYKQSMRNRAINYLRKEIRHSERECSGLAALLDKHASVSLAARI